MPNFAERLKMLRDEKKLFQKELSLKLDIPRATIAAWETRSRVPELSTIEVLADFFGVSVDYLIGRSNIRNFEKLYFETQKIMDMIKEDEQLSECLSKMKSNKELLSVFKQICCLRNEDISQLSKGFEAILADRRGSLLANPHL